MIIQICPSIRFVRWKGVNRDYSTEFGYVPYAEQESPVLTRFRSLPSPSTKRSKLDETFVIFPDLSLPRVMVSCRRPVAIQCSILALPP